MPTNESLNQAELDQLRELILSQIEGDDPFRKEKVKSILNAKNKHELNEVYA